MEFIYFHSVSLHNSRDYLSAIVLIHKLFINVAVTINGLIVTVHSLLFCEVFWHENAKFSTARYFLPSSYSFSSSGARSMIIAVQLQITIVSTNTPRARILHPLPKLPLPRRPDLPTEMNTLFQLMLQSCDYPFRFFTLYFPHTDPLIIFSPFSAIRFTFTEFIGMQCSFTL